MKALAKRLRAAGTIAIALLILCGFGDSSQGEYRTAIAGNHPEAPEDVADFVSAPASKRLRMEIVLGLRNEAELDRFLESQQDPDSPDYQRALSSDEFSRRFGPTSDDVEQVTRWLKAQGFTVESADAATRLVEFAGNASAARSAFGVQIAASRDGKSFTNTSDPVVPAWLASKILLIDGLDNLNGYLPNANVPGSGANTPRFAPLDFQTFYDELPLLDANPPIDGSGADCIGAVEGSDVDDASLTAFNTQFNLPAFTSQNFVRSFPDRSSPNTGDGPYIESLLDIEWSHAVAPGAKIILYSGNYQGLGNTGLVHALAAAVKDNKCGSVAVSFGVCGKTASYFQGINKYYKQAVAQMQTVLVATGDTGAAWAGKFSPLRGCYAPKTADVNEMATSPSVTAVGASQFKANYDTDGNDVGSVAEQVFSMCATLSDGSLFCLGASGGGKSAVFAKPAFQAKLKPVDGQRGIPDVVLGGNPGDLPGFYLGYDPSLDVMGGRPGAKVYCCVGGTSLDSPAWAGIIALASQKKHGRLGNINPHLYALAKANAASLATIGIRDITSGNNTYNVGVGPGSYIVKGYNAGAGYDLASGWGSVDVNIFLNAFLAP